MHLLIISVLSLFLPACAGLNTATTQQPISRSETMSFKECLGVIQRTSDQLSVVPKNIVNTVDLRMVRFLTADGSILVTCSRPDRRLVITISN